MEKILTIPKKYDMIRIKKIIFRRNFA